MTTCAGCGFVYENFDGAAAPKEFHRRARELRERLGAALMTAGGLEALRRRPEPAVWSALEYAGHVRDVLLAQRERLFLALVEERPAFAPMYRDDRVTLGRYNDEDPATTGTEAVLAADLLGRAFAPLTAEQWRRPMLYGSPEPAEHDLIWLARHTVHECRHHLGDVDAALAAAGFTSAS